MVFDMLDVSHISDQERLELNELLKLTGVNLRETLNSYVDVLSDRIGGRSEPEDVDLEECLNGVLPLIESIIRASKATIHTDFSEAKSVKFNRAFMDSVYLNLISNSLKYARPDIAPIITIRSEKSNGTSRVIFTDNGLGFDLEQNRNRIFGINQTFHDHHDSKGVGLYLVHSHVTSMGGEIDVESKVGEGTRFTMTFPDI
jgi:signal transduction histidine kinase